MGAEDNPDDDVFDMVIACEEIKALQAENQRLREENNFLKSFYQPHSLKMDGEHSWRAMTGWPKLRGPTIDEAVSRAMAQVNSQMEKIELDRQKALARASEDLRHD